MENFTSRDQNWTPTQAKLFLSNYETAATKDDAFTTINWVDDTAFDARGIMSFTSEEGDSAVYFKLDLVKGNTYTVITLIQELALGIAVYDSEGYQLRVDRSLDLSLQTMLENAADPADVWRDDNTPISDFKPSYTGTYYVVVDIYNQGVFGDEGQLVIFQEGTSEATPIPPSFIIDEDGFNWDNDIQGPWEVIEAEDAQLYRAYMGAMGRTPDKNGFDWWSDQIESGNHSLSSMAAGFITSDEFMDYADTNGDNAIDDDEFVTHMYEGVFGRSPDQGGYDYWMGELSSGASDQADVLVQMTQSNEYIDQTLETVADYLFI